MSDTFLAQRLSKRESDHSLRRLRNLDRLVDFSSNDYLGFARSQTLQEMVRQAVLARPDQEHRRNGSTGSRLISGNSTLCEQVEAEIAEFHGAEAGLIFNSGYDANLGLLASVPQRGDTVIYDELVHASIRDGIRIGFARAHPFRHNDLMHLQERLQKATGTRFVVVESVYSMDGDEAALVELVELCRGHEARLIVDEAHATGVFGTCGVGLVAAHSLQSRVFARVHTFGKALGTHGAIVLGSDLLRQYLLNFARSFIYTTALPPHSLLAIRCAYQHLRWSPHLMDQLHQKIHYFQQQTSERVREQLLPSRSAIQSVTIPGNQAVRQVATALQSAGYDVRPILSPTVPTGKERIRICLHAFNQDRDICNMIRELDRELVGC